ncbi:hypothetical protein JCM6882_003822 [Rhodosporidiobolus microsporus]
MSASTTSESPVLSSDEENKRTAEGTTISPFDRLPDELIIPILEQVFLDSDNNPRRHEPSVEIPHIALDRRFYRLAREVWYHSLYRDGEKQEDLFLNLLLHHDVRPLVRRIRYQALVPHIRHDTALLASLTNLVSLDFDLDIGFRDDEVTMHSTIPRLVTNAIRSLPQLEHLRYSDYHTFSFEDTTFSSADLPRLRSLEIEAPPCDGVHTLIASTPRSLDRLSMAYDTVLSPEYEAVPWVSLRHFTAAVQFRWVEEDDEVTRVPWKEYLFAPLGRAIDASEASSELKLPLERFELTNSASWGGDDGWENGFPMSLAEFGELVALLNKINLRHLVLLWDSSVVWHGLTPKATSITTLTIRDARELYDYLPFRNLCTFLLLFSNLKHLHLRTADFTVPDTDPAFAEPSSSLFTLQFPHVVALVAFLRPRTVLHLTWESTFGERYVWSRASTTEEFVCETSDYENWDL